MAKKHDIVIVSDEKWGCEHGIYIDGDGLGITEGALYDDLKRLSRRVKGPFTVRTAKGIPDSLMHWPDRLEDVEELELFDDGR